MTDTTALDPNSPVVADAAVLSAPRTRWAAIIWGGAFALIAGVALWITVSADRRATLADWTVSLSPATATAYIVLAFGALALVAGIVGIARRAQRGVERRRSASA